MKKKDKRKVLTQEAVVAFFEKLTQRRDKQSYRELVWQQLELGFKLWYVAYQGKYIVCQIQVIPKKNILGSDEMSYLKVLMREIDTLINNMDGSEFSIYVMPKINTENEEYKEVAEKVYNLVKWLIKNNKK